MLLRTDIWQTEGSDGLFWDLVSRDVTREEVAGGESRSADQLAFAWLDVRNRERIVLGFCDIITFWSTRLRRTDSS